MTSGNISGRRGAAARSALWLTLASFTLAACSAGNVVGDTKATFGNIYDTLLGSAGIGRLTEGPPRGVSEAEFRLRCPKVEVRPGTAHYVFYAPGAEPTEANVRFQGTIRKTARQCEFNPDTIKMKFGFAGRVLLGPRGGEGAVELPIRAVLAWRNDEVAWTKLYKVPVRVEPGEREAFFAFVEKDFQFEPPEGTRLSEYQLYVGFDGNTAN